MTKTKTKVLAISAAAVLTAGIAGVALSGLADLRRVEALDATSTVTYPFDNGANSFQNATIVNSAKGTDFNTLEITFDKVTDFTSVDYVAVQLNVSKLGAGNAVSFGAGFFSENMGGIVYWDTVDKNYGATSSVLFQTEDGKFNSAPLKAQKTDSDLFYRDGDNLVFSKTAKGTLWIPTTALNKRGWDGGDLSKLDQTRIKSLYLIYNVSSSYDWELQFGSIGVYEGEPDATQMKYVADCTRGERRNGYFLGGAPQASVSFNSDKAMPKIPYAFAEGEDAFKNTVNWKPTAANETLTVNFDEATADLSNATHLLVQYFSTKSPRLQFTLSDGTKKSAIAASKRVFFMPMGANYSEWFVSTNASGFSLGMNKGMLMMGMVIVPIENLASGVSLAAVSSLEIKTGGATDVIIGGVASYTAERGDGAYADGTATKLLDLATSKINKFTASAENTLTELQAKPNYNTMYGTSTTVTQDLMLGGKTGEYSEENKTDTGVIFNGGGAYGKAEATKDTYNNDAMKVTATAAVGDGYMAMTNLGGGYSWAGAKGVTLWARNDSEIEVSFNIELECTAVVSKSNGNKQIANDRFNVTQGNRFYLYDVNTGKTSIYMTRPTVSLPVGFEGWVFVPFTAFDRASWSNAGVTDETFMGENSYVSFVAFSVEAAKNLNASFSVNSVGAYYETPKFESAFVNANGKSIPELMGLNAQEEN